MSDARYDFSATINVKTTRAYSRLFPFLYSPFLFLVPSRRNMPLSFRSRPFNRLLRAAKCTVASALMPLRKKSQTTVYLYSRLGYKWLVCTSASCAGFTGQLSRPDSRIYRTRNDVTQRYPLCAVFCMKLYIISAREKNALKVGVNCRNC